MHCLSKSCVAGRRTNEQNHETQTHNTKKYEAHRIHTNN